MTALEKFGGITLDTIHDTTLAQVLLAMVHLSCKERCLVQVMTSLLRQTDQPVRAVQEFVEVSLAAGHSYADTDHQIVTCMNKSWIGTQKLNLVIQAMFWDRARPFLELPRYRIGK